MPLLAQQRVGIMVLLLGLRSLEWYDRIARLGYRFFYYHPRQNTLHEVRAFDADSVLSHRPYPARHILVLSHEVAETMGARGVEIAESRS